MVPQRVQVVDRPAAVAAALHMEVLLLGLERRAKDMRAEQVSTLFA